MCCICKERANFVIWSFQVISREEITNGNDIICSFVSAAAAPSQEKAKVKCIML